MYRYMTPEDMKGHSMPKAKFATRVIDPTSREGRIARLAIDHINALEAQCRELREALEELVLAPGKGYEVVGRSPEGYSLSAEGVARTRARAVLAKYPRPE
jgi:hypothetical protein